MGWNGTHPVISKAEAKKLLPAGACKRCIYWTRCNFDRDYSLCTRCSSKKSVRYAPFTDFQSDVRKILGQIAQSGYYIWATDCPCPEALKVLIKNKIVSFREKRGILAYYMPMIKSYMNFTLRV